MTWNLGLFRTHHENNRFRSDDLKGRKLDWGSAFVALPGSSGDPVFSSETAHKSRTGLKWLCFLYSPSYDHGGRAGGPCALPVDAASSWHKWFWSTSLLILTPAAPSTMSSLSYVPSEACLASSCLWHRRCLRKDQCFHPKSQQLTEILPLKMDYFG